MINTKILSGQKSNSFLPITFNDKVKPKFATGFKINGEVTLFYFNNMAAYNWLQSAFNLLKSKE